VPIRVAIMGSTGSIGRSALDVVRRYPTRFRIVALGAHANVDLLARQIVEFKPERAALADPQAADKLRRLDLAVQIRAGAEGMEWLAQSEADIVLCAIAGAAGLKPILSAIEKGTRVALANKEPMVMAGRVIMEAAKKRGVPVIPVDSEHNAIFQCLHGRAVEHVRYVYLTASGGPFYGRARESLATVTPSEAAQHPRWDMGLKISVDSATLMNKGLEIVEAMWLFDLPIDKIRVVMHPQSIVHGLVEFTDGSILAHLGPTDMKVPILFAFTWPERVDDPIGRLDLTGVPQLSFAAPDFAEFPCLDYAFQAARTGGTAPAILNAANEMAVEAFCESRIAFLGISEVVRRVMEACPSHNHADLATVLEDDQAARVKAKHIIDVLGV
jgi:1-deoxy-D-xylulose-5-phosphate reductoisomerase